MRIPILAQADRDLIRACGDDPGTLCTEIFERTGSVPAAWVAGRLLATIVQIALIVAVAYIANRAVRRAIKRFVRRLKEEGLTKLEALANRTPLSETAPIDIVRANMRTETIGGVLRSFSTLVIWGLAVALVLGAIGLPLGPLLASAGIAGVALGFGAQSLVKDVLSGIFILIEDQYGIGDIVDTGEATGTIEAVSLRTTRLRSIDGVVWYVPNGEIRRVGNMGQQWSRALLDIGVAYDTDLGHASAVLKETADGLWRDAEWGHLILDEPSVWGVQAFADSEITLRLVVKTVPLEHWAVERELRARIKRAFDDAGIAIPFPQRTVWMRHYAADEPPAELTRRKRAGNDRDTAEA